MNKPIQDFENFYEISSEGEIYSLPRKNLGEAAISKNINYSTLRSALQRGDHKFDLSYV